MDTNASRRYRLLAKEVGAGTYGSVHRAEHVETGKLVAVKRLALGRTETEQEISVWHRLRPSGPHENLMHLLDAFAGTEPDRSSRQQAPYVHAISGSFYVVFDFMDCTLADFMKGARALREEAEAAHIFRCVADGIAKLHTFDIIHGDLSFRNILLRGNFSMGELDVRVADLGCSFSSATPPGPEFAHTTAPVRSPEACLRATLTTAADVWALGVIGASLAIGDEDFWRVHGWLASETVPTDAVMMGRYMQYLGHPTEEDWPGHTAFDLGSPSLFRKAKVFADEAVKRAAAERSEAQGEQAESETASSETRREQAETASAWIRDDPALPAALVDYLLNDKHCRPLRASHADTASLVATCLRWNPANRCTAATCRDKALFPAAAPARGAVGPLGGEAAERLRARARRCKVRVVAVRPRARRCAGRGAGEALRGATPRKRRRPRRRAETSQARTETTISDSPSPVGQAQSASAASAGGECKCTGNCGRKTCKSKMNRRKGQKAKRNCCSEEPLLGGNYCLRCKCEISSCNQPRRRFLLKGDSRWCSRHGLEFSPAAKRRGVYHTPAGQQIVPRDATSAMQLALRWNFAWSRLHPDDGVAFAELALLVGCVAGAELPPANLVCLFLGHAWKWPTVVRDWARQWTAGDAASRGTAVGFLEATLAVVANADGKRWPTMFRRMNPPGPSGATRLSATTGLHVHAAQLGVISTVSAAARRAGGKSAPATPPTEVHLGPAQSASSWTPECRAESLQILEAFLKEATSSCAGHLRRWPATAAEVPPFLDKLMDFAIKCRGFQTAAGFGFVGGRSQSSGRATSDADELSYLVKHWSRSMLWSIEQNYMVDAVATCTLSQVSAWTPDQKQHLRGMQPFMKFTGTEISNICGVPASMLSCFPCLCGALSESEKQEAMKIDTATVMKVIVDYEYAQDLQDGRMEGTREDRGTVVPDDPLFPPGPRAIIEAALGPG